MPSDADAGFRRAVEVNATGTSVTHGQPSLSKCQCLSVPRLAKERAVRLSRHEEAAAARETAEWQSTAGGYARVVVYFSETQVS